MSHPVHAEVAGSLYEVLVAPGDAVAEGDPLLLIESMKMEIPVEAPVAGTVASVHVIAGDPIAEGQLVVTLDAAGA